MVKSPKQKAEELIADFLEMLPNHLDKIDISMKRQYEFSKCQAEYCAHHVKFSHTKESDDFEYWNDVQLEINKL